MNNLIKVEISPHRRPLVYFRSKFQIQAGMQICERETTKNQLTLLLHPYFTTLAFNSSTVFQRGYQSYVFEFPARSDRSSSTPWNIPPVRGLSTKLLENRPNWTALSSKLRVSRGEKLGSTQTRRGRARVERLHLLLTTPYHRQPEERDIPPRRRIFIYIYIPGEEDGFHETLCSGFSNSTKLDIRGLDA